MMYSPSARLAELVSTRLDDFFEAVEKDHVQVGLWQGDLHLQNLRLRPDAITRLWPQAPLAVHTSSVGSLHLKIPWGSLTAGKASLVVHSVRLCVQPRAVDGPPHPDVLRAMEAAVQLKKQELVKWAEDELYKIQGGRRKKSWGASLLSSIATSVLTKLLQNLEVDIRNVDVILHGEDPCCDGPHAHTHHQHAGKEPPLPQPFVGGRRGVVALPDDIDADGGTGYQDPRRHTSAIGLHLKRLHVGSSGGSNSSSQPAEQEQAAATPPSLAAGIRQLLAKSVDIEGLGLYVCDQHLHPAGSSAAAAPGVLAHRCPYRRGPSNPESPYWLARPLALKAAYRASSNHPKHGVVQDVTIDVAEHWTICITRDHYLAVGAALADVRAAATRLRYWTLRPRGSVSEEPGAWWRYAKEAVLLEVRRQEDGGPLRGAGAQSRKSWGRLLERARLRGEYMQAYTTLLVGARPGSGAGFGASREAALAAQQLQSLEQELSAEEILLYRAVARTKARLSGVGQAQEAGVLTGLYQRLAASAAGALDRLSSASASASWVASPLLVGTTGPGSAAASLSSESTFDDVAKALFVQWGQQSDHAGAAEDGTAEGQAATGSYFHVNLRVRRVAVTVDAAHTCDGPRRVCCLEVGDIAAEGWMAIPGEEMGLNLSVGLLACLGADRGDGDAAASVLSMGALRAADGQGAVGGGGGAALVLHLDLCPLAGNELPLDEATATEFALSTYLSKAHVQHRQVTLEVVAAPLRLHLEPRLLYDLGQLFLPSNDTAAVPAPSPARCYQDLRYLAACRKAYDVSSHVDWILRRHVSVNLALSLEAVELQFSPGPATGTGTGLDSLGSTIGLSRCPSMCDVGRGSGDVVLHLKGARLLKGAYLEALLLAEGQQGVASEGQGPGLGGYDDLAEVFILRHHSLAAPSPAALKLLQSHSSAYVERSYVSIGSIGLDAVVVQPQEHRRGSHIGSAGGGGSRVLDDEDVDMTLAGPVTMRLPILARPLGVELAVSSCILPAHPAYPKTRLELLLSPLELRLSQRRALALAAAARAFRESLRLAQQQLRAEDSAILVADVASPPPPPPPRLALLSSLVMLHVDATTPSISVALHSDDRRGPQQQDADGAYGAGSARTLGTHPTKEGVRALAVALLEGVVREWAHFSEPGHPSPSLWQLARAKLVGAGFSKESAEAALEMLCPEFAAKRFVDFDTEAVGAGDTPASSGDLEADAFLAAFAADVAQRVAPVLAPDLAALESARPLAVLTASGVVASYLRLAYDSRASVSLDAFQLVDEAGCSILQLAVKARPPPARSSSSASSPASPTRAEGTSPHRAGGTGIKKGGGTMSPARSPGPNARAGAGRGGTSPLPSTPDSGSEKALTVTFTDQDHEHGWGRGGYSAALLRRAALGLLDPALLQRTRDVRTAVSISEVSVMLQLDRLVQQLDGVSLALEGVLSLLVPAPAVPEQQPGTTLTESMLSTTTMLQRLDTLSGTVAPPLGSTSRAFSLSTPSQQQAQQQAAVARTLDLRWAVGSFTLVDGDRPQFKLVMETAACDMARPPSGNAQQPPHPAVWCWTVGNVALEDLTPGGEDYPVVLSKKQPQASSSLSARARAAAGGPPMMTLRVEPGASPVVQIGLRGARVCFTNRSLRLWLDLQAQRLMPFIQKAVAFPRSHLLDARPPTPSEAAEMVVPFATAAIAAAGGQATKRWVLSCDELTLLLPRNSGETDLGALEARSVVVESGASPTTWKLPDDPAAAVFEEVRRGSTGGLDASMETCVSSIQDELFQSASGGGRSSRVSDAAGDDEEAFFDAYSGGRSLSMASSRSVPPSSTADQADTPNVLSQPGICQRMKVRACDVRILVAVVDTKTQPDDLSQLRTWGAVAHGEPVYIPLRRSRRQQPAQPAGGLPVVGSPQLVSSPASGAPATPSMRAFHWEEVTRAPTTFDFLWDGFGTSTRYLLAFRAPARGTTATATTPALAFDSHVTMTQLYLLLSVWYDNLGEGGRFYARDDPFAPPDASGPQPVPFPDVWPAYDTRHYFARLAEQQSTWDFGLVAPSLALGVAYDRDSFLRRPPSFFMADNDLGAVDAARITLQSAVLNVSGGQGALKLAFGAGHMQALDIRGPARTLQPDFLTCGAGGAAQHGFIDADFGFTMDLRAVAARMPLQVTLAMTPDNWMCINVGLQDAEAAHKDLSVVWLFCDIFSYYFRFPFYGKPPPPPPPMPLSPGEHITPPLGGIDVRVWATRPCVSAPEDPLAKDTATLVVHGAGELFYRYKADGAGSSLHHVRGDALSIGLGTGLDAHLAVRRLLAEGQWGPSVADSRILVDRLSLDLLYCYDRDSNHLEVQASLPAFERGHAGPGSSVVYGGRLQTKNGVTSAAGGLFSHVGGDDPFVQPPPFAVHPLEVPSRSLVLPSSSSSSRAGQARLPCYIMGSHVDLAFVLATVTTFIGPTEEALAELKLDLQGLAPAVAPPAFNPRAREARKGLRRALATHLQGSHRRRSSVAAAAAATAAALVSPRLVEGEAEDEDGQGLVHEEGPIAPLTCHVTVEVAALKILLLDPTLGLHLPLVKLVVGDLHVMVNQGPQAELEEGPDTGGLGGQRPGHIAAAPATTVASQALRLEGGSVPAASLVTPSGSAPASGTAAPEHQEQHEQGRDAADGLLATMLNVSLHMRLWSDYFNIALKCWEPLLEPFNCRVLYEDGSARGRGLTVRSHCPLLLNVSTAFLQTLTYASRLLGRVEPGLGLRTEKAYLGLFTTVYDADLRRGLLGDDNDGAAAGGGSASTLALQRPQQEGRPHKQQAQHQVQQQPEVDEVCLEEGASVFPLLEAGGAASTDRIRICHDLPKPLLPETRAPFSICNLTGQAVRCFQPHLAGPRGQDEGNAAAVSMQYLRHGEVSKLSFGATMTVLRNLRSVEVPFDVQRDLFLPYDDHPGAGKLLDRGGDGGLALTSAAARQRQQQQQQEGQRLLDRGWSVSVQLGGYRWLTAVSADVLGVRFESLRPLPGQLDTERLLVDWRISNALKLVSEVRLVDGCRQLSLRSVFRVRNCTKHEIMLVAHPGPDHRPSIKDLQEEEGPDKTGGRSTPTAGGASRGKFTALAPGGTYNVPLLLLRLASGWGGSATPNLGRVWVRPRRWQGQGGAGTRGVRRGEDVQFSTDAIDLRGLVDESAKLFDASLHHEQTREAAAAGAHGQQRHLMCPIVRGGGGASTAGSSASSAATFPPVSYCVEVVRTELKKASGAPHHPHHQRDSTLVVHDGDKDGAVVPEGRKRGGARGGKKGGEAVHEPVEYLILIHPPLVLENLLPEACVFELHDPKSKTLLWKAHLQAGQSVPIHDVRLDSPLRLIVQTEYCRSPEGALIHRGHGQGAAEYDEDRSLVLVDTENQKLVLELDHQVGGAGQRRTTVYCPYWLVNVTNCMLTYLQEGKSLPPAGTVMPRGPAANPAAATGAGATAGVGAGNPAAAGMSLSPPPSSGPSEGARRLPPRRGGLPGAVSPAAAFSPLNVGGRKRHKQWPGEQGLQQFHRKVKGGLRTNTTKMSTHFTDSFDLEELCDASFMFNFAEDTVLGLSQRRLKVKVNDSAWSKGFSLDTVGVNQVLAVRHPQWGDLEVGFVINLAPGRLGQYTKVVFFCPRYVVWNRHPAPLYLCQDATYFRLGHISDEVASQSVAQAHLPRASERRVAVQLKGGYEKSSPFLIDEGLDLCLKLSRQTDLSRVKHLATRKAPEFDVFFPPRQEIGLWLETDWSQENLVVKAIKANRWAETTEVQKGDVLLTIEGQPIAGKNFKRVMGALKELLATTGATLRFRTHEEHMRLLRLRALGQLVPGLGRGSNADVEGDKEGPEYITVQLKPVGPSVYVIVGKLDAAASPPYRIVNKTKNFTVHFRQLGCDSHPWVSLAPHESTLYTWDEPLKAHRLDLRVGVKKGGGQQQHEQQTVPAGRRLLGRGHVPHEFVGKNSSIRVRLDEIGFVHSIPLQDITGAYSDEGPSLVARVEAEGTTRVLYVSKDGAGEEVLSTEKRQEELAKQRQLYLRHRGVYQQLREEMLLQERMQAKPQQRPLLKVLNLDAVESAIAALQAELGATDPHIRERHHLLVEVKEAKGLKPGDISGLSDPFVQLSLKVNDRLLKRDASYRQRFTTYVVEKTLSPKWQNQLFIFRVPPEAHTNPKSYSIRVKVKDFDGPVKKSDFLGQIDMQLDVLENEAELDGWYFLTARPQLFQQSPQTTSDQPDLGAIHLRMQWVHSLRGLVSHLGEWTESKLRELDVQEQQLEREKAERQLTGPRAQHRPGESGFIDHRKLASVIRSVDFKKKKGRHHDAHGAADSPGCIGGRLLTDSERDLLFRHGPGDAEEQDIYSSPGARWGGAGLSPLSPTERLRARVVLSRWRKRQRAQQLQLEGAAAFDSDYAADAGGLRRLSMPRVAFAAELMLKAHSSGSGSGPGVVRPRSLQPSSQSPPLLRLRARSGAPSKGVGASSGGFSLLSRGASARSTMAEHHSLARRSFTQEVARSHRCVNNPGGTLQIRALQANNLGERAKPVYVTVRYGLHIQRTGKAKPGVYPRWETGGGRNELALQVEHLNTSGTVHITVWSEHELQDAELGRIDVPLGAILDCCGEPGAGDYVRWFPLLRPTDAQAVEGDSARGLYPWTTEKISSEDFANDACIKLAFRWTPFSSGSGRAGGGSAGGALLRSDFYLRAHLTEFSLAAIDSHQRLELFSLTVRSVEARYVDNPALTRASVVVACLQLDNQLPRAEAPIVFGPTPMQMQQPLLHCSLFREKGRAETSLGVGAGPPRPDNLVSLKYVFVLLQEVDLRIEEEFIGALWRSLSRVLLDHLATTSHLLAADQSPTGTHQASGGPASSAAGPTTAAPSSPRSPRGQHEAAAARHALEDRFVGVHSPSRAARAAALAPGAQQGGGDRFGFLGGAAGGSGRGEDEDSDNEESYEYLTKMVYIEQLELCPIKVNISVFKNAATDRKHWRAAPSGLLGELDASHLMVNNQLTSTAARRNPRVAALFTAVQLLTDVILPLVPSISDASIKLNALDITHVFQSPEEICATLQAHYTSNFLFQLYKIIGSVDIIGNPLSFASSLGTGVIDFFYEPAQGLIKSPKAFVRGVVKGTSSLVTNTATGFLGAAGKISKSVGSGVLVTLSKDQRFMHSRERLAKEKNEVYIRPFKDFFHGVFHGVTGIVADPYYGAKRDGPRGCVVGLGYGVIGVVVKPIVGVLDAIAHTSEGFRDLAMVISLEKRLDPLRRHRLQHVFALDGRLLPYDVKLARGALVLAQFGRKASKKNKQLVGGPGRGDGSNPVSPASAPSLLKQEMGGAMAAVEAAGRTMFASTKQVVSAVAGTLNIVEAREETLHEGAWGADTKDDSVILTEILRKGPGEETVVVVSTKRVVCAEYTYRSSGAPEVQLLWQAPLKAIRALQLKNMPLALVFHIDRHAAKAPGAAGQATAGATTGTNPAMAAAALMALEGNAAEDGEAAPEGGPARMLLARHGAGGGNGEEESHHIVQKRILGDWQQDNVALMRVYNLVQCLLGRTDEVETEMGYGFGIPCEGRGFQFGVWEFCPPDGSSSNSTDTATAAGRHVRAFGGQWRPSPRHPDAAEDGLFAAAAGAGGEGAWPIFQLLERVRWLKMDLEDDPMLEMAAAMCTTATPSPSISPIAASSPPFSPRPSGPRGSLVAGPKPGGPLLVVGAGMGGGRSPLLGQPIEAKLKAPVAAGRLSSQGSSSSGTSGRSRSQTVEEEPLSPPTGAGQRASGGRQVVVEEGVITRLMEKIDSLEARLREFEHHEEEGGKGGKKKGTKR